MEEETFIVEALFSNEREAQVMAAKELGKLASKLRQKLAEKGIISRLVMMLHTQDCEAMEAALLALLSLAFHSERNKVRIANSGAIPALLNIIIQFQNQSEVLIDLSVAALLILSSSTPNKLAIASSGAIQLLIQSLNSQFSENGTQFLSIQAQLDVLSTFHNLSTCPQIIPSIVSSGMVCTLLHLVYNLEKSSGLAEKALALLEKVVLSSEIALNEVAENASVVIQLLVEAIEEGRLNCKEHAVGILLVLCQSCRERYRGMILREGAIPGLLQLSVDGTFKAREKAKSLLQLLRDCSPDCVRKEKQSSKNYLLERVMRQIDGDERNGIELRIVEEMIAKLRT
ncbi:OLC1v1011693C1 [Oldenlandia corymbosa var. corymbosa]|uniref:OLC1v1011693C1 n=1 Tax=Oldenlandia corymbosa var. corymbosa TaxID=529605 RepID=A0AAV1DXK4_OLDCO|nr:OLC1v1011693C1 [Oldenlandia corymbosa var. corymbosa]